MITVNALGEACPMPVVKTKKAIDALTAPETVQVLVDNDAAVQNLIRLAGQYGFAVRAEKQGNKNLYTPLVRRLTYCGAVSQAHLQTLYGGDIRAMVCALADTGRMTYADTERLLRWLTEYQAANPEYDYE